MNFLYIAHIPFVLLFLAFTIGLVFWSQPSRDCKGAVTPALKGKPK